MPRPQVALSFVALGGIQPKAQVTVKGYTLVMTETGSKAPERRIMENYLKGLGDGMPPKLPFSSETFKNILDSEIKREFALERK